MKTKILNKLYQCSDYKREISVSDSSYRSEFRRDYDRLIHSPAFRRLQGKTQLFPGIESDFFRNRLTHSYEVAQIAKSLALRINAKNSYFKIPENNINTDLVEMAALAHDLGHPPFGHNGEYALDECMRDFGGFEGNAQTLRIITRLEKKQKGNNAGLVGLNLTYRSICALLKYDQVIPEKNINRIKPDKLVKGYYESEEPLVLRAKESILNGATPKVDFKTIECSIMDIADDIAYSTYDLEDAFKAGFANPLEMLGYAHNGKFLDKLVEKVDLRRGIKVRPVDVFNVLISTFGGFIVEKFSEVDISKPENLIEVVADIYAGSKAAAADGYLRTELTSALVNEFINGVDVVVNKNFPVLSTLKIKKEIRLKIEVLKHFTFEAMIMSPRLKVVEYRGKDIVRKLFEALTAKHDKTGDEVGYLLLPDDYRDIYLTLLDEGARKRLICDFIAGMTDKYAIEFYGRLTSVDHGQTFYKPL